MEAREEFKKYTLIFKLDDYDYLQDDIELNVLI